MDLIATPVKILATVRAKGVKVDASEVEEFRAVAVGKGGLESILSSLTGSDLREGKVAESSSEYSKSEGRRRSRRSTRAGLVFD